MLPSAALMPPCAATVWERVGKSFVTTAVLNPSCTSPKAARRPAHRQCYPYSLPQGCESVFIWYGSGSSILGWIPDPGVLMTKNWKKFTTVKFFLIKNYTLPCYKRSLQLLKENIQHFKHVISFSTSVGHFCPPGSGSTDPIESGSATLHFPHYNHHHYSIVNSCHHHLLFHCYYRRSHNHFRECDFVKYSKSIVINSVADSDPVPFWPLDLGWIKNQDLDPRWISRIIFPRA